MKTFARIESSVVVELLSSVLKPNFHSSLVWVECPAGVQVGNTYIDGQFQQRRRSAIVAHSIKVAEINTGCESAITGGFWSQALGERYQYSSQLDDQLNLTGVILAGLDSPYACRDEQGVKEFRQHTFTQLRRVGDDFTLFKLQLLQRANTLKQQLDQGLAANDVDALEAIRWEALT